MVHRQLDRVEPELARRPVTPDMNMRWLVAVEAVEEEPEWAGNP
jgi:hypothetical protein